MPQDVQAFIGEGGHFHVRTTAHSLLHAGVQDNLRACGACAHVQIDEKLGQIKELFNREAKAKQPPEDAGNKSSTPAPTRKDTNQNGGVGERFVGDDANEVRVKMTLQECSKIISMVDWGRTCEPLPACLPACLPVCIQCWCLHVRLLQNTGTLVPTDIFWGISFPRSCVHSCVCVHVW
jgi:hypothetical protein